MTLKELQKKVDDWISTIGVRYFNVQTNTLILNEEVGEFSSLVARVYGEQSFKKEITKEEQEKQLKGELADILFVVVCLANQMDIDLEEAIKDSIEKKTKRDKTRHLINKKLL